MTKTLLSTKYLLCAFFGAASFGFSQIHQESGGIVVLEMEDSSSPLGLWKKQNSLDGYSGDGYLQFLGNTYISGQANSPLEFNFKINQAGLYYLHLHCAKETHDGRTDVANDCYVRVEGDYKAGPGPHANHGDNASLALLKKNTKYFGGAADNWKWENGQNSSGKNGNLDPGGHSNKRVAVYDFKAGETYKLVVSGRSKFFRIDRIVFRHASTSSATAQNLKAPDPALVALQERFKNELRGLGAELRVEIPEGYAGKSLSLRYKTRKYQVYPGNKSGQLGRELEEREGPDDEGILLRVHVQEKGEVNQAPVPQTIQEAYWKTYLNVYPVENSSKQIYFALSFHGRTDTDLISKLKSIAKGGEKP
ncbi:hypothetical protein N9A94_00630 [Akkermansiaceae bacterium]|nr:hypothetical protein [Akkermansiaceae bacterium]MDA7888135.1 hypothetical protein [Akkermansiaceae bacterium]